MTFATIYWTGVCFSGLLFGYCALCAFEAKYQNPYDPELPQNVNPLIGTLIWLLMTFLSWIGLAIMVYIICGNAREEMKR